MIRKTVPIEVESKDENGGRIIISTSDIDRDKDRVIPFGAQIQNYLKNPVVKYGHNYRDPWATVGRTTSLEITERGIVADFELRPAANEQDPQNIVLLLWDGEWIRTASIGFAPLVKEENEGGGFDFTEWELLEWSLIPVPANQSALRLAVKALAEDDSASLSETLPEPESAELKDKIAAKFLGSGNCTGGIVNVDGIAYWVRGDKDNFSYSLMSDSSTTTADVIDDPPEEQPKPVLTEPPVDVTEPPNDVTEAGPADDVIELTPDEDDLLAALNEYLDQIAELLT
jgi:HK97 family phage prohead protease